MTAKNPEKVEIHEDLSDLGDAERIESEHENKFYHNNIDHMIWFLTHTQLDWAFKIFSSI